LLVVTATAEISPSPINSCPAGRAAVITARKASGRPMAVVLSAFFVQFTTCSSFTQVVTLPPYSAPGHAVHAQPVSDTCLSEESS
jgi:hypothetical protein